MPSVCNTAYFHFSRKDERHFNVPFCASRTHPRIRLKDTPQEHAPKDTPQGHFSRTHALRTHPGTRLKGMSQGHNSRTPPITHSKDISQGHASRTHPKCTSQGHASRAHLKDTLPRAHPKYTSQGLASRTHLKDTPKDVPLPITNTQINQLFLHRLFCHLKQVSL
jgi:hypothetical protein